LLSHPHLLGRDADELDKPSGDRANYFKQEGSEPGQAIPGAGENPNVSPRIEIVFSR
jgi:hypothetical protein